MEQKWLNLWETHNCVFLTPIRIRWKKKFHQKSLFWLPTDSTDLAKVQNSVHFSKHILLISLQRTQEQNQKRGRGHGNSSTAAPQICTGLCEQPRSYFHLLGENFKTLNLEMDCNFPSWNSTQTHLAISSTNSNPRAAPWLQPSMKDVVT